MYVISKVSLGLLVICVACSFTLAKTTLPKPFKEPKISAKNVELPSQTSGPSENLFLRLAKSLAVEAFDEFKESARRVSRQTEMNMTTLPMLPNITNPFDAFNITTLLPVAAAAGIPVSIAVSTISLKAAVLTGIAAIKAAIVNIVIKILWVLFLISGTAYFVCNLGIVNCMNLGGGGGLAGLTGGSGGGLLGGGTTGSSLFNSRASVAEQYDRHTRPVYKALDEGFKKYR